MDSGFDFGMSMELFDTKNSEVMMVQQVVNKQERSIYDQMKTCFERNIKFDESDI